MAAEARLQPISRRICARWLPRRAGKRRAVHAANSPLLIRYRTATIAVIASAERRIAIIVA